MIENKIIFNEYLDTFHSSDETDAFNEDPTVFESSLNNSVIGASSMAVSGVDTSIKIEHELIMDDENEQMSYSFEDEENFFNDHDDQQNEMP